MDYEALRSELDDLAGLDLSEAERDRLINEGYVKLACESEWARANLDIATTVADQQAYSLPASVYRILRLKVGTLTYYRTDEETVDRYVQGDLYYRLPPGSGWYWISFDAAAAESVSLYPAPTTAGTGIVATVVLRPDDLEDDADEPALPREFHRYILSHAKAEAYGALEDDPEGSQFHRDQFDRGVAELRRLRLSKGGRSPVAAKVKGIHV